MSARRIAFFSSLLVVVSCSVSCLPESRPFEPLESLGDPDLPQCGFDIAVDDNEPPPTTCDDGEVLASLMVERTAGPPTDVSTSFSSPSDGFLCVAVENDGTASGSVRIDGDLVHGPNAFTPLTDQIRATRVVETGTHELAARITSAPGSSFEVTLRFSEQDPGPRDPVTAPGGLITVSNVFDAPDPFSPGIEDGFKDSSEITALASVRRVAGLAGVGAGAPASFSVAFRVTIVDSLSCHIIRSLDGVAPIGSSGGGTGSDTSTFL